MGISSGTDSIAQAYAQALYNVAKPRGIVEQLLQEVKTLTEAFKSNPRLAYFLESPQISAEKKHNLTEEVFHQDGRRLNPLLMNLLRMMIDRERAVILPKILIQFREIAERAEGIYPARITSARELGLDEKQKLQAALEKFTHSRLRVRYSVDPALLGGIVFRFRDVLIDGSIRHGLRQLRDRLEAPELPTHEGEAAEIV